MDAQLFPFLPLALLFFSISRRVEHSPTPASAGKRVADLGNKLPVRGQGSVCACEVKSPEKIAAPRFSSEIAARSNKEELFNRSQRSSSDHPPLYRFDTRVFR